jgi:lanthanide-dependent methanol dehydrogenase
VRTSFVTAVSLLLTILLTPACKRIRPVAAADIPIPARPGAEDGNWVTVGHDYAINRFSGLDQINTSNVNQLRVAWTFSTGTLHGHEAAPLVIGDTMYVITPYPNNLYALDLRQPGRVKWVYAAKTPSAAQGVACCDTVNRGVAYADGKIIFNALDAVTIAVDATTGKEAWKTKIGDINRGESMTMAPLVVKGKVLVGNSGGEFGVRGALTALNVTDGKVAWKAWSTGPDSDVLIGPNFKPPYEADRKKDLGVNTWPKDAWRTGGGTVWGFLSYDPDLNLLYYGTANPGPWNPDLRPGDNKWSSSVFARRPETGEAVWAYQWSPHDMYDHDGINENLLADLQIGGQRRRVLIHCDRNGFLYVLDRENGRVISADKYVYVNSYSTFDMNSGRPVHVPEKMTGYKPVTDVCPAPPGGKDWQPTSFSPRTNWLYIPHQNMCMDFKGTDVNYLSGTPYVGAEVVTKAGPGGHRGEFTAWDPVARKAVWKLTERFPVWSGTVVTAGDVVFYGTMDRWFKAVHARTGQVLWQFQTGSGVIGQPISYRGPDGKQYIAVFSGVGGWAGAIVVGGLDPRDPTGALGMVGLNADLPKYTNMGGQLYVFSLP